MDSKPIRYDKKNTLEPLLETLWYNSYSIELTHMYLSWCCKVIDDGIVSAVSHTWIPLSGVEDEALDEQFTVLVIIVFKPGVKTFSFEHVHFFCT